MCTTDLMYLWTGGTANVPQKQFWIIGFTKLVQYSMVFNDFRWAASYSNTVNTMGEKGNS